MPPTTRLPTVQFRSLLSQPINIRLQTLCDFVRPRCATIPPATTCLAHRRSLHLYKTARAKTVLGMHKTLDFERYDEAPLSESDHKVNIVQRGPQGAKTTIVAEGLSLQEVYDNHVGPGKMLYRVDEISKKLAGSFDMLQAQDIPSTYNNYAIVEAGTIPSNIRASQKLLKQHGALKNTILLLSSPVPYQALVLDRSYQFIEHGSPVEFRIRFVLPAMIKKYKGVPPSDLIPWMLAHFPHLRPDFILKSMPQGTDYTIKPFTDGLSVQFVLAKQAKQGPKMDLTVRLERVKDAVRKSLGTNHMAQNYLAKKERNLRMLEGASQKQVAAEKRAQMDKVERGAKGIKTTDLNKAFKRLLKASRKDQKKLDELENSRKNLGGVKEPNDSATGEVQEAVDDKKSKM
ncbi:hypothetical protein E8E13_004320 [Curvularia kusanoi]|uniref:Uncharacterized protein n=1 Tax=Curvularia kusanoi TaxID=90978 RepID=A0A9P4TG15_CURKU|nr:hypothetical protein E8E13_004320 [Curvularia kusanoi]